MEVTSPSLDTFFSRILEEPMGPSIPATTASLSSSGQDREANSPVRKRPKQVRKKSALVSLAVGEALTMENISMYYERALVGNE